MRLGQRKPNCNCLTFCFQASEKTINTIPVANLPENIDIAIGREPFEKRYRLIRKNLVSINFEKWQDC